MANKTVNLSINFTNHIRQYAPYTVYKTNKTTEYKITQETISSVRYSCILLGKVSSMPSALKHNALVSGNYTIALKNTYSYRQNMYLNICKDYDENAVNYNERPGNVIALSAASVPANSGLVNCTSSGAIGASTLATLLENLSVKLTDSDYDNNGAFVYSKAVLANGSTLPYFTITYDDSAKIRSKISYANSQLTGSISTAAAKVLTWSLVKDTSISGYCAVEEWEQVSATFNWRVQGASEWNTISVSGSTTSVTIPAYTFPSGSTIEYYISETDEDNTTSNTDTYTFTTLTTKVTPTNSPTSGYVNPRNARSFSWSYTNTAGTVQSGETTLHWRVSGSDSWNDVVAASGANSLTIPANTFPVASTIQWYLSGTDVTGYASQTSVYSFTTAASSVKATAISPSSTIESNNQPITFRWNYSSSDGFAPTRYRFMWKLVTDSEWTTLLNETEIVTQYTFPAYTFPAGEISWIVIPNNIDDVVGTGQSASFICYGAPEAPVVYAEAKPYTTVTWQSSDQQAYQIKVDDTVYGPYFGTEKSFELPDYLEDGEHTIGVAVIGTYALWSAWGEATITIQNVPGAAISLDAEAQIDVELMISTEEENPTFLIYRDDKLIAKTNQRTFVDRLALGEHTYKVVSKLTNGNYNISNEITRFSSVCSAHIAPLVNGEWLEINYTLKDQSDPEYEDSITTTYNHLSGSEFPSVSISEFRNKTVNYSAVFLFNQADERKAFDSLYKKPVIMKFKDGTVFVGVLEAMSKRPVKKYYTAYTFTLTRVDFEDYIDDTE